MIVTLGVAYDERDREIGRLLDRVDEVLERCDRLLREMCGGLL